MNRFAKKTVEINYEDALRVVDGLELAASWDKTAIYYVLKQFIRDVENEKDTPKAT